MLSVVVIWSFAAVALAHTGATGIVKERMDFFSRSKDNLKLIKSYLQIGDLALIVPLAEEIRDWAHQIPDYFPEGSGEPPSEASPEIWKDFTGFQKAAEANFEAASQLAAAARTTDGNKALAAFKNTAKTCKNCHKQYRLD